jgi:hypothetical protein
MVAVLRGATLRLIALLVLFSGAADYFAFDRSDPLAPMSAAETPSFIRTSVSYHLSPTTIRHTDTQDDGCICCAAGFPAHPAQLRAAAVIATANAFCVLPPADPQLVRVDPPPRA